MAEQKKKTNETLDVETLSDEELDAASGGFLVRSPAQQWVRNQYQAHFKNGGTREEWSAKKASILQKAEERYGRFA